MIKWFTFENIKPECISFFLFKDENETNLDINSRIEGKTIYLNPDNQMLVINANYLPSQYRDTTLKFTLKGTNGPFTNTPDSAYLHFKITFLAASNFEPYFVTPIPDINI